MIVDAHHHLWDPARRTYPWMTDAVAPIRRAFTKEDLRKALPPQVKRTIVVQALSSIDETRELLQIASRSETIGGVVGWVDLTSPDVAGVIRSLRVATGGSHLVGIRHQVEDEADPQWLCRADVLRGLRAVADAGLPYDLLVRPHQLDGAFAAAKSVPELQFVLDHAAKPDIAHERLEPWSEKLARLATAPNVACKLSGFVTEASWTDPSNDAILRYMTRTIETFGARRMLFGSDWPVCLLAASYDRVLHLARTATASFSDDERRALFCDNAVRLYRLEAMHVR